MKHILQLTSIFVMVHKLQARSKGEWQNLKKVKSPMSYQGPQGLCSWRALQRPSLIWLISSSLTGLWNKCHLSLTLLLGMPTGNQKQIVCQLLDGNFTNCELNKTKQKLLSPLLFINYHFRHYVYNDCKLTKFAKAWWSCVYHGQYRGKAELAFGRVYPEKRILNSAKKLGFCLEGYGNPSRTRQYWEKLIERGKI